MNSSLLQHFDLLATAPGGVARLRELILTLAVQGKLVPQDPADEPASVLLQRVTESAAAHSKKGLKSNTDRDEATPPYELPTGWAWCRLGTIVENMGSGWSPACDEGERSDPTKWAVLRTTAVQINEYRACEHKVLPSKLSPRPEIEVKDGDILITRAGPMNRVGISCWVNSTPPRLMLSDKIVRFHSVGDEMLPAFIVLTLNAGWTKSQIEAAKTGMAASQVNISQTDLRDLWLPVCSKAEQSRIVARVEELMRLCDALEAKGKLDAAQHTQLVQTLLGTLTDSASPAELAAHWQRVAEHFDLLLDRPEAVDALEQTILQLAVRGLLVPQDPNDEPASVLLQKIRTEKDRLIAEGKIKRDKPLAPIADEEKPFKLPQGWAWARFGDVSVNRDAERVPVSSSDREKRDKIYDYYGASGVIDKIDGFLFDKTLLLIGEDGANLLNRSTPIAFLANGKYWVNNHAHVIDATEEGFLDYLVLFINAISLEPYVTGTAQPKMNQAKLNSIPVALPPLEEQTHIITRVEELRQLCTDLRQRLTASRTTQAHLAETLVEAAGTV